MAIFNTRPARFRICVLLCAALPFAARAQDAGERREAGRSAWFACTSLPAGFANPAKVMSGKDITDLELPEFITSEPVKVPEDGILRIVRVGADPVNPDKQKVAVLAQAKVPDKVRQALVILAPLPKPDGDLIFAASVQDLSSFKGGDRMFINLSDTNIAVQIGETGVDVPARHAKICPSPALAEATNVPIVYRHYDPNQKKWKLLTATTVVIMPTRREICIFNNGSRAGKIKRHKILFPVPQESP